MFVPAFYFLLKELCGLWLTSLQMLKEQALGRHVRPGEGPIFCVNTWNLEAGPSCTFFKLSRLYRQGTDAVFVQKTKPINVFDTYFVAVIGCRIACT